MYCSKFYFLLAFMIDKHALIMIDKHASIMIYKHALIMIDKLKYASKVVVPR